jgi:hypothetical protein
MKKTHTKVREKLGTKSGRVRRSGRYRNEGASGSTQSLQLISRINLIRYLRISRKARVRSLI